ncbi:MAG: imidazole glycerol phosphate synthase subunit HisH [Gammaproteobacteria bacterium]|jgi:imidazole glycerol-phosphate synthase subunit HisH|nr:imidazole glycerol phosphate synthase subunit HisH [Gammaproteobacteria bacterium]MBT4493140.1 imidazole glycerol phosphate synthase subunit HisH [Gammaproteobacteria bacterium]MBT7371786.1 imidazole glycerol phosphate synthase subunit HisH [Gammaproteobacteria bacterium]
MPVIVDYDAGNVRSVQRACEHVGMVAEISADPDIVARADRLIFPGVGSAESAVDTLRSRGLDEAIKTFYQTGKPLLGICLGLQILLEHTEEGDKDCLGLVEGACERFEFADRSVKVPHIGWNEVEFDSAHPIVNAMQSGDEFYFVHSFYAKPFNDNNILGRTEYGGQTFCSVVGHENLFATQFHLEKSGELGLRMLKAFSEWTASC